MITISSITPDNSRDTQEKQRNLFSVMDSIAVYSTRIDQSSTAANVTDEKASFQQTLRSPLTHLSVEVLSSEDIATVLNTQQACIEDAGTQQIIPSSPTDFPDADLEADAESLASSESGDGSDDDNVAELQYFRFSRSGLSISLDLPATALSSSYHLMGTDLTSSSKPSSNVGETSSPRTMEVDQSMVEEPIDSQELQTGTAAVETTMAPEDVAEDENRSVRYPTSIDRCLFVDFEKSCREKYGSAYPIGWLVGRYSGKIQREDTSLDQLHQLAQLDSMEHQDLESGITDLAVAAANAVGAVHIDPAVFESSSAATASSGPAPSAADSTASSLPIPKPTPDEKKVLASTKLLIDAERQQDRLSTVINDILYRLNRQGVLADPRDVCRRGGGRSGDFYEKDDSFFDDTLASSTFGDAPRWQKFQSAIANIVDIFDIMPANIVLHVQYENLGLLSPSMRDDHVRTLHRSSRRTRLSTGAESDDNSDDNDDGNDDDNTEADDDEDWSYDYTDPAWFTFDNISANDDEDLICSPDTAAAEGSDLSGCSVSGAENDHHEVDHVNATGSYITTKHWVKRKAWRHMETKLPSEVVDVMKKLESDLKIAGTKHGLYVEPQEVLQIFKSNLQLLFKIAYPSVPWDIDADSFTRLASLTEELVALSSVKRGHKVCPAAVADDAGRSVAHPSSPKEEKRSDAIEGDGELDSDGGGRISTDGHFQKVIYCQTEDQLSRTAQAKGTGNTAIYEGVDDDDVLVLCFSSPQQGYSQIISPNISEHLNVPTSRQPIASSSASSPVIPVGVYTDAPAAVSHIEQHRHRTDMSEKIVYDIDAIVYPPKEPDEAIQKSGGDKAGPPAGLPPVLSRSKKGVAAVESIPLSSVEDLVSIVQLGPFESHQHVFHKHVVGHPAFSNQEMVDSPSAAPQPGCLHSTRSSAIRRYDQEIAAISDKGSNFLQKLKKVDQYLKLLSSPTVDQPAIVPTMPPELPKSDDAATTTVSAEQQAAVPAVDSPFAPVGVELLNWAIVYNCRRHELREMGESLDEWPAAFSTYVSGILNICIEKRRRKTPAEAAAVMNLTKRQQQQQRVWVPAKFMEETLERFKNEYGVTSLYEKRPRKLVVPTFVQPCKAIFPQQARPRKQQSSGPTTCKKLTAVLSEIAGASPSPDDSSPKKPVSVSPAKKIKAIGLQVDPESSGGFQERNSGQSGGGTLASSSSANLQTGIASSGDGLAKKRKRRQPIRSDEISQNTTGVNDDGPHFEIVKKRKCQLQQPPLQQAAELKKKRQVLQQVQSTGDPAKSLLPTASFFTSSNTTTSASGLNSKEFWRCPPLDCSFNNSVESLSTRLSPSQFCPQAPGTPDSHNNNSNSHYRRLSSVEAGDILISVSPPSTYSSSSTFIQSSKTPATTPLLSPRTDSVGGPLITRNNEMIIECNPISNNRFVVSPSHYPHISGLPSGVIRSLTNNTIQGMPVAATTQATLNSFIMFHHTV